MGGGAWPFLVGGVICLLNCDNERDLNLLNSQARIRRVAWLLRGTIGSSRWKFEAITGLWCPYVLGRTRATLTEPTSTSPWPEGLGNLVKLCRAGDRALQLLLFNEEFLVSASHQLALITSLPFVHTARRYYRLNGSVRPSERPIEVGDDHLQGQSWSNLVI